MKFRIITSPITRGFVKFSVQYKYWWCPWWISDKELYPTRDGDCEERLITHPSFEWAMKRVKFLQKTVCGGKCEL